MFQFGVSSSGRLGEFKQVFDLWQGEADKSKSAEHPNEFRMEATIDLGNGIRWSGKDISDSEGWRNDRISRVVNLAEPLD